MIFIISDLEKRATVYYNCPETKFDDEDENMDENEDENDDENDKPKTLAISGTCYYDPRTDAEDKFVKYKMKSGKIKKIYVLNSPEPMKEYKTWRIYDSYNVFIANLSQDEVNRLIK